MFQVDMPAQLSRLQIEGHLTRDGGTAIEFALLLQQRLLGGVERLLPIGGSLLAHLDKTREGSGCADTGKAKTLRGNEQLVVLVGQEIEIFRRAVEASAQVHGQHDNAGGEMALVVVAAVSGAANPHQSLRRSRSLTGDLLKDVVEQLSGKADGQAETIAVAVVRPALLAAPLDVTAIRSPLDEEDR